MGRLATPNIRTACGMGRCPKVFRSVAGAMKHIGVHRIPSAPQGREKPIWQVRWDRHGEIKEVISGPLPNLPVHEGLFAPAGRGASNLARGTV